jgi:hypothetical protein
MAGSIEAGGLLPDLRVHLSADRGATVLGSASNGPSLARAIESICGAFETLPTAVSR